MESVSGVTSSSRMSLTSPPRTPPLDGGPKRHDLIRVDAPVRLLAEEALHLALHRRHAGLAADQDNLVDVPFALPRILQRGVHGRHCALDEWLRELLELGPGQRHVEVLRSTGVGRDERQIDVRLFDRRKLDLCLLGGLLQTLQGHPVLTEIDALLLLELIGQVVDDRLIEVVATEVGVTIGGLDLEDALRQIQHRDVVGAAAQVIDRDLFVALVVQTVRQRRGGRLVDDALHVQAGDAAGVLCRVALSVVEVRGHRDHRLGDLLAEIGFGVGLQLLQDHRRDFLRAVPTIAHLDLDVAVLGGPDLVGDQPLVALNGRVVELATHEALD